MTCQPTLFMPDIQDSTELMAFLQSNGVETLQIDFNGGGDEGQLDQAELLGPDNQYIESDFLAERTMRWARPVTRFCSIDKHWQTQWDATVGPISEALEDVLWTLLEKTGVDWINNEGGNGTFTLNLARKTLSVQVFYNEYEPEALDPAVLMIENIGASPELLAQLAAGVGLADDCDHDVQFMVDFDEVADVQVVNLVARGNDKKTAVGMLTRGEHYCTPPVSFPLIPVPAEHSEDAIKNCLNALEGALEDLAQPLHAHVDEYHAAWLEWGDDGHTSVDCVLAWRNGQLVINVTPTVFTLVSVLGFDETVDLNTGPLMGEHTLLPSVLGQSAVGGVA